MLLCIGMCSAHVGAEKPSVVSATPTVGESYYLYNVGTGKFLSSYNYKKLNPSLSPYGLKLTIGSATDGGYTITVASTQGMLYASSTQYIEIDTLGGNETRYSWNFIKQEDGTYKIQCAQNNAFYVSNNYVGWNNETIEQIRFEQTGYIDWAFLTQEDYEAIAYQLPTTNYDFPELPASKLVSGSTYYLYNVDARGFLRQNGSSMELQENPEPIQIEKLENGAYTMRFTNITNGYIYSNSYECNTNNSSYYAFCRYWTIEDVGDDTYMIQRSPLNTYYYNSVEYMGWSGNHATIVANQPQDYGAKWKLIPADASGNKLMAQLKLYHALAKSDAYAEKGWNISYYADLYAARATSSIEEMNEAAYNLRNGLGMSAGYIAPYWNERPILFQTSEGSFGQNSSSTWAFTMGTSGSGPTTGTNFTRYLGSSSNENRTSTLCATFDISEPSAFIYGLEGDENIKVYVDDSLARDLQDIQTRTNVRAIHTRFLEDLTPGTHTIKWVFSGNTYVHIYDAGVMASPLISVNLLEPGSLGTEVLYNTDHIKNVRRLKIKGKMNTDDWSKIKMMHYLQELDLSEAEITEIPKEQFSCESDTSSLFLHKMVLPEGLKKIRESAFEYSLLDKLEFPSTLSSIERYAFQYSHIQQLDLPDNLTDLGYEKAFYRMHWLKKLNCPKNLRTIPRSTFERCYYLEEATLPKELETIGQNAFYGCHSMKIEAFPENLRTIEKSAFYDCYRLNPRFNDKLQSIGEYAFYYNESITSLTLPESVTTLGEHAFHLCWNMKEVTISSPIWYINDNIFDDCHNLKTLRLNCPTVVGHTTETSKYPVPAGRINNIKLVVPEHLVTSYKQEPYWYNFKSIEGFSTEEIQQWRISNPLVLNRERFKGNPDIIIAANHDRLPSLKINGDSVQEINLLRFQGSTWNYNSYAGQLLSNCNNVKINDVVQTNLETGNKQWHFFCLPYDVKVSDIIPQNNAQKSVRYYDGANRAANGAAGSWKNYGENDTIPAGTGFIMQTNMETWTRFTSFNDTKQNVVANKEFVKTLEVNDSEIPSNKGWNLVGNPWQCFYNDHALNFTAPITVWNTQQRTYTAYSITDDDYAIRPNEAFFVQCPDAENTTIGFPTQGRQLNAVIESQNAVKGKAPQASNRQLVDLVISNGETEDRTRVVLNEDASIGYEVTRDASKMMSMDSKVSQLYTLGEDDTPYAINERPLGEGLTAVGYYAGEKGKLTIRVDRCQAERVYLTDYETNETIDLTSGSYTFTTDAGTNNVRFVLGFDKSGETGITIAKKAEEAAPKVYTIDGKFVGSSTEGLKSGVYVVSRAGKSHKMLIK